MRLLPLSPKWLYRIWYRLRLPVPVQLFTGGIDLFHSPDFVLPPLVGDAPSRIAIVEISDGAAGGGRADAPGIA